MFLLAEDEALKKLLTGMTVADEKNANRAVQVWFGQPDIEIRRQAYPYVVIELVDVAYDPERAMGGLTELPYTPDGMTAPAAGTSIVVEYPIPVKIVYQVTTFARQPRHDRQIVSQLFRTRLPFKYGGLDVVEDGTVRPLFLTGFTKRDTTEDSKRLFLNIYTVEILSEITPTKLIQVQDVINRTITVTQTAIDSPVTP